MSTHTRSISAETLSIIEELARNVGLSPDEYLRRVLPAEQELAVTRDVSDQEFETDMELLAESSGPGTYDGSYSRTDIYADHD